VAERLGCSRGRTGPLIPGPIEAPENRSGRLADALAAASHRDRSRSHERCESGGSRSTSSPCTPRRQIGADEAGRAGSIEFQMGKAGSAADGALETTSASPAPPEPRRVPESGFDPDPVATQRRVKDRVPGRPRKCLSLFGLRGFDVGEMWKDKSLGMRRIQPLSTPCGNVNQHFHQRRRWLRTRVRPRCNGRKARHRSK
jgi:hypothetical protein